MKRNKLSMIAMLAMILILCIGLAYAIDKPSHPDDPFEPDGLSTLSVADSGDNTLPPLSIAPSPNSLMGSSCSNLYKTTGEYCSSHIRIYYQCLETMDGGEWQQRSENCGDYPGGGRCIEEDGQAKCVDFAGTSPYGTKMLVIGLVLIAVGVGTFFIPFRKKNRGKGRGKGKSKKRSMLPYFVWLLGIVLVLLGIWMLIKMILGGV